MHKKVKQTIVSATITASMFLAAIPVASVSAKKASFTTSTKNTTAISVKELDYDLSDPKEAIEIDFKGKVKMTSATKASVKDSSGKSYTTKIHDYDSNDISLNVSGLKAGKTYTVTISKIKKSTASSYGTLTVKFSVPKASTSLVKDVEYDAEDREVSFDFRNKVTYSNAKVTITSIDKKTSYTTKIVEKENDELSVYVKGLKAGKKYSYKITGVKKAGSSTASTLSGSFTAVDND